MLKGLLEKISDILGYLNPFSDKFFLKGLVNIVSSILDYLNPFSENFFGKKLIELLGDLLEFLFVPDETRILAFQNVFTSKLDFIDSIKYSVDFFLSFFEDLGTAPKIELHLSDNSSKYHFIDSDVAIIDLSFFEPFKTYSDLIITAFVYLFFCWRIFINIPNIISGGAGVIHTQEQVQDIQLGYKKGGKR